MVLIHSGQPPPFADYRWEHRIIVIDENMEFAQQQLNQLLDEPDELTDRDLLVFLKRGKILICQNAEEEILEDIRDRYVGICLIGKDGGVKLRKDSLVDTRHIFDLIDSMPMRQSEMRKKSN